MNKRSKLTLLSIILFLALFSLSSYVVGLKLGNDKGSQDIKNSYTKQYRSDLGELLQEISFVISLEGQVGKVDGRVLTLKKGLEEKRVWLSPLASFVKGADFNEPDGWSKSSLTDLKINSKVRVTTYMVNSKELTAYQIFIYQ